MKIGPKYKIARRLGSPIFEKTQGAKFALSLGRKEKSGKSFRKPKSEFGLQLIEKQKARFTYGLTESQFRKYVKSSLTSADPVTKLFHLLESRLDNGLYRGGLAKTRLQARQLASHGHATLNGRRVSIPSISLKVGDVVGIREGSAASPLFLETETRMNAQQSPAWLSVDPGKRTVKVEGVPVFVPAESLFDLRTVIEYYNR